MAKSGQLTAKLVGAGIGTNIIVGVLDGINTSGNTVLAILVPVGKYILLAVMIMYAVNQIDT